MFGDLLLPPENFGKKPSGGSDGGQGGNSHTETHKNIILVMIHQKQNTHKMEWL